MKQPGNTQRAGPSHLVSGEAGLSEDLADEGCRPRIKTQPLCSCRSVGFLLLAPPLPVLSEADARGCSLSSPLPPPPPPPHPPSYSRTPPPLPPSLLHSLPASLPRLMLLSFDFLPFVALFLSSCSVTPFASTLKDNSRQCLRPDSNSIADLDLESESRLCLPDGRLAVTGSQMVRLRAKRLYVIVFSSTLHTFTFRAITT